MEFKTQQEDLLAALSRVQSIVEKRSTMPILQNILLKVDKNTLKIFATDLEVSLVDEIQVGGKTDGGLAVSAKNLFDIIKELDSGAMLISKKENNSLIISQKRSEFNLLGVASEEYPVFPTYATNDFIAIERKLFLDMIDKTVYSVSNDLTRYHLNGVFFEAKNKQKIPAFRMVATDGHRMSLVDREATGIGSFKVDHGVIIPRKGVNEIRKLLEAIDGNFEIAIEGAQFILKNKNTVLMVRLVEGKYPNYQQLIPEKLPKKISIKRESLITSLKRVSLLANQKSRGVVLSISKGKMEIASNDPELGNAKEELDVDYDGVGMKISFNAKYILDVLNACDKESVDISLNDQLSPGLVRPHNDNSYTCVVMPMRI
ncbi:MAG: DNA polymerase III subunit beta [Pseudomonadota bacterium]|nr:DNA polymerase III subunit beta [Pseudomonadota bacterium]